MHFSQIFPIRKNIVTFSIKIVSYISCFVTTYHKIVIYFTAEISNSLGKCYYSVNLITNFVYSIVLKIAMSTNLNCIKIIIILSRI